MLLLVLCRPSLLLLLLLRLPSLPPLLLLLLLLLLLRLLLMLLTTTTIMSAKTNIQATTPTAHGFWFCCLSNFVYHIAGHQLLSCAKRLTTRVRLAP